MENTVESILGHGEKDPQLLIQNLKNGGKDATSLDEELARQLSSQVDSGASSTASRSAPAAARSTPSTTNNQKRGRGTPTTLPDDFLRIKPVSDQSTLDADEALARMLQDELFSEELRRNPDFAHLAGRRPTNQPQQQRQQQQQAVNRNSFAARGHQPMPMPNIMEKLSGSLFIPHFHCICLCLFGMP